MATIKINELGAGTPVSTDLVPFADPTTGLAEKATITQIATLIEPLLTGKADLNGDSTETFEVADATSSTEAVSKGQLDVAINALQGALIPQGNWDASTNTPDITGTTATGYYWIVSVDGSTSLDGITDWKVNDWAVKTATGWAKIDNSLPTTLAYKDQDETITGEWTFDNRISQENLGLSTFFGFESGLNDDLSDNENTAFGYQTLKSNTSGTENVAIGNYALMDNTTAFENIAVGAYALTDNTTGSRNTAVGFRALWKNTTGENNTAFGFQSLDNNLTSSNNTALGRQTLFSNTIGTRNVAAGYASLYSNINGDNNIAFGFNALYNSDSDSNTAVGYQTLYGLTSGGQNVALGFRAGRYLNDGVTALETNTNSLYLGYNTKSSADGSQNEIVIGFESEGNGSNTVTLGNDSITNTYLKGIVNGVGSGLTALNASNISSGTLADARLSANVPLLNVENTFSEDLNLVKNLNLRNNQQIKFEDSSGTERDVFKLNTSNEVTFKAVLGNDIVFTDSANNEIARFTDEGSTGDLIVSRNVQASQFNLSALNTAPSSASDTGTVGEIKIDANHIYVCTATNTWKRVAIATW